MLKNKFRKILLSVCVAMCAAVVAGAGAFSGGCDGIRESILRLHVIANSDSQADQALKLKVRDRLLEAGSEFFQSSEDIAQAEEKIAQHLTQMQTIAQKTVHEAGYDYPVAVSLSNEYFNTRTYENVTLPAGYYDAVRVVIGSGTGKNWWCVMFPPMCLPAAEDDMKLSAVLSDDELAFVTDTDGFEVRFKVVEWYETIKHMLKK